MPYDRYLIAPFDENSGLTTDMKPWQIPDSAWAQMKNAFVFRGRIKKRFGSRFMGSGINTNLNQLTSRLRQQVGTIAAPNSPVPGSIFLPGQMFSAGTQLFIVTTTGATQPMLATGPGSGTFSTTNGAFTITGTGLAGSTPIYWYPAQSVMGLAQYEFTDINNYQTIGYDTQFAYQFINGSWQISSNSPIWHGSDADFFWSYNWVGANVNATALTRALFTTNFQVTNINGAGTATDDPMYYYNGTTWVTYRAYLNPAGGSPATGPFVQTARIIVPFHGRLLLLNTIENDGTANYGVNTNFVNRVRYTFLGTPFAQNAWYGIGVTDSDGLFGTTAGFEDASTLEAIISAEFIKDRLIVYFEESTWELSYTGNEQRPFEWQKLNTELGSMATFSTIAFDKAILTVGEVGIHSCNGSNVVRIDEKIPTEIFSVSNPSLETQRICGIRDYYNEMVYWSLPISNQRSVQPYPTRVLVYNYQNKTWSANDDCITTFGYFDTLPSLMWETIQGTWAEWNSPWNTGSNAQQVRQIIAGNQQGFTFIIDTDSTDSTSNAAVLQITAMTNAASGIQMTIYNHMLITGDYIYVVPGSGATLPGQNIYQVIYVDQNTVIALYPPEVVAMTGIPATITGTYLGGSLAGRVSNYDMYSKQWNPYDKDGSNVYVAKIDFSVTKTPAGQITIDYSPSSTQLSTINDATASQSITGTNILETSPYPANLYPLEQFQDRLWHPVYFQTDGECIQINIYMSPIQICNPAIAFADFELHGMVLHVSKTSSRLQ